LKQARTNPENQRDHDRRESHKYRNGKRGTHFGVVCEHLFLFFVIRHPYNLRWRRLFKTAPALSTIPREEYAPARRFPGKHSHRRKIMKNLRHMVTGTLFATIVLLFATGTARAQDPVKVAPEHFKVLLDNDQVRVLEFHGKPGDKIPMHSHPNYFVYSSLTGKTKYTYPDGKTEERETKAGEVSWRNAETHASENVGTGEAHSLLVEIKVPAKKKTEKSKY
jgi:quercetin dioxygenase-like cupin family protein